MKYFHELTEKERAEMPEKTVGELMANYSQPEWCNYPDALGGTMGCWSLLSNPGNISKAFCSTCECSTSPEQ